MYWKPIDCRVKKKLLSTRDQEIAAVRHYLENDISCRRQWLLQYFDPSFTTNVRDPLLCCDVCAKKYSTSLVRYFIILYWCTCMYFTYMYTLTPLSISLCIGLRLIVMCVYSYTITHLTLYRFEVDSYVCCAPSK